MIFDNLIGIGTSAIAGAVISIIVSVLASFLARRKLPIAYSVAIIGFPRSGKTTLITSLFAEIFARRIPFMSITPRGEETIKRVNDNIYRLERGEILGPTTDQDLFAYRAELRTGQGIFSKRYKFEVGDFPGEDSEDLATKDIEWLHDLPYFKWAMEADAFVFVIDVQKILNEQDRNQYRALISRAFRASWQRLIDHHYDGKSEIWRKPVVLVFSKADLLLSNEYNSNENNRTKGKVEEIDERVMLQETRQIEIEYSDLIEYFKSECKKFSVVFTSAYKKSKDSGTRVGVKDVLKGVMPR